MNTVRFYVESLPDSEKIKIIEGYEQLELAGAIGDEPIRQHVEMYFKQNGFDSTATIVWMQLIAFECYRYFTSLYLKV